jgi:hypothetical protein
LGHNLRLYLAIVILLGLGACVGHSPRAVRARIGWRGFAFGPESSYFPVRAYRNERRGLLRRRVLVISVGMPPPYVAYYFDRLGQLLAGCPYQYGSEDFRGNRAIARKNDSLGVINRQGQVLIPFRYRDIRYTRHPQRWCWARAARGWQLLDSLGHAMTPPVYEQVRDFSDGMAGVARGGRWGFVDARGREQIAPAYYHIWQDFHEGFAAVRHPDTRLVGVINKRNEPITAFKYHPGYGGSVHFQDDFYFRFTHGYALIRDDSLRFGVLDTLGREVLPQRFARVEVTDSVLIGHRGAERVVYRIRRPRGGR